ncbi:MAG: hypothetical protein NC433_10690 [Clostridiales bacterium]|nr:hypothetical protein [Clostridiales bacterium]
MKKLLEFVLLCLMALMLSACGSGDDADDGIEYVKWEPIETPVPTKSNQTVGEETEKIEEDTTQPHIDTESSGNSTKTQADNYVGEYNDRDIPEPNLEIQKNADELLDSFINGQINAVNPADTTQTFYITDLNMDSGEWDSYSVGEKADLDNDGENELIICGPYGGIYLDARDNKVYEFARGEGTGVTLSYTVYKGDIWIMYSNCMNVGYKAYHMEKFEGADNLVAEMNFGEELVDADNPESEMKYTLNGMEISSDEYYELGSRIFAAEVYAN